MGDTNAHLQFMHNVGLTLYNEGVLSRVLNNVDLSTVRDALQSLKSFEAFMNHVPVDSKSSNVQLKRQALVSDVRALLYQHWAKGTLMNATPWVRLEDHTRVDDEYVLLADDDDDWQCADQKFWLNQLPEYKEVKDTSATLEPTAKLTPVVNDSFIPSLSTPPTDRVQIVSPLNSPAVSLPGTPTPAIARPVAHVAPVTKEPVTKETLGPIPSLELLTRSYTFKKRRRLEDNFGKLTNVHSTSLNFRLSDDEESSNAPHVYTDAEAYDESIFSRLCTLMMAVKGDVITAESTLRSLTQHWSGLHTLLETVEERLMERKLDSVTSFETGLSCACENYIKNTNLPVTVKNLLERLLRNNKERISRLKPISLSSQRAQESNYAGGTSSGSDDIWEVSEEVLDQSANTVSVIESPSLEPIITVKRRCMMRREATYKKRMLRMARLEYSRQQILCDRQALCRTSTGMGLSAKAALQHQKEICAYSDCRHTYIQPPSTTRDDKNQTHLYFPELDLDVCEGVPYLYEPACPFSNTREYQPHQRSSFTLANTFKTKTNARTPKSPKKHTSTTTTSKANVKRSKPPVPPIQSNGTGIRKGRTYSTSSTTSMLNNLHGVRTPEGAVIKWTDNGSTAKGKGVQTQSHSRTHMSSRAVMVMLRHSLMVYLAQIGFQATSEGVLDRLVDVTHEHLRTLTHTMRVLADQKCSTRPQTRHKHSHTRAYENALERTHAHTRTQQQYYKKYNNGMIKLDRQLRDLNDHPRRHHQQGRTRRHHRSGNFLENNDGRERLRTPTNRDTDVENEENAPDDETTKFMTIVHKAIKVSGSSYAQIHDFHVNHIKQRDTMKFISDNSSLNLTLSSMDTDLPLPESFDLNLGGAMNLDLPNLDQFGGMTMPMGSHVLGPMMSDGLSMGSIPFGPMASTDDLMADLSLPDLSNLNDWAMGDDLLPSV
eukprot:CFRG0972T1